MKINKVRIRRNKKETFTEKLDKSKRWTDIVRPATKHERTDTGYVDVISPECYSNEYILLDNPTDVERFVDPYELYEDEDKEERNLEHLDDLLSDIEHLLTPDEFLVFREISINEYSYRYAEKILKLTDGSVASYEKLRRIYERAKSKLLQDKTFENKYREING